MGSATFHATVNSQTLAGLSRQKPRETSQPDHWGRTGIECYYGPRTATSINNPFIHADVFRIGELRALVDSGAKNSAISEELLLNRSCFEVHPPSKYRFIDGTTIETWSERCLLL